MERKIETFGDARSLLVDTIIELKEGKMDVSRGMAVAATMKVLNDNIQAEINAGKLILKAAEVGKNFGDVMQLGQQVISNTKMIEND